MLKQNKMFIPITILILILISVGLGWWLSLPRGDELPASIRITPTATEESGIPVSAGFHLTSEFAVHEANLRGMLALEPSMNYTLTGGGKDWEIKPVLPLKENTVYTIRVKNMQGAPVQSFAFQTRTDLLIQSVFPQEKETYVDVNTGIEIKFNRPGVDLSQGFEILPPVSGRFETLEYTCRFIPENPLDYNSIYRITLKGLRSSDGAVLTEPIVYNFTTQEEEGKESWDNLTIETPTASFLPGGNISVPIWGGDAQAKREFNLTLHKYAGIKVYEAALRQRDAFYREQYGVREDYRIPTVGLDEIMNVTAPLLYSQGRFQAMLPADLSEGYYLFTLSGAAGENETEQFAQQLIQVVNLSVYTQSTSKDTLFWVGDPVNGRPASGVEIAVETGSGKHTTGKTDSNGSLLVDTAGEDTAYALITREGTPVWIAPVPLGPKPEEEIPLSTQYHAALYTDREIYQPGEAISFWGIVKPRTNQAMPTEVQVALTTSWPDSTVCEMSVAVAKDGTFSAKLQPETLQPDAYSIAIRNQSGEPYLERYLEISDYTKPAYQITLETDKDFYYYGETVNFSVQANYYDGTPAAGVKLRANCYNARVQDYVVTLDADGKGTFKSLLDPSTARMRAGVIGVWQPQYVGWSVENVDEQAVNFYEGASFLALPSKITAKLEYQGAGKVAVSSAFLDESKLMNHDGEGSAILSDFDRYSGNSVDLPMTLVVHRVTWVQNQTGTYYDPVNKQNIPIYETTTTEAVERNVPVNTVNGSAVVSDLPSTREEGISYWYELRFAGGVYGDVCETAYPAESSYQQDEPSYTFFADTTSKKVAVGEKIDIGIYENGLRPQSAGTVLYTLVQEGTEDYGTYSHNAMQITMEAEYLPNIWLVGAYFDGKAIYPIERTNLSYDYEAQRLDIDIKTDKEDYRPGDTMQVSLTVKDAQGKPVSGQVAVGVVDEAVFDVSAQTVDLAGQLYRNIYYPNIVTGMTRVPQNTGLKGMASSSEGAAHANDAGAPMTGGGGITRSVFSDTAAFEVVTLAADGTGKATLTLPHNITSWRITAAAVTPQLQAGDTVTNARASLPFYLMPIVSDTYLLGDDISVSVQAVGKSLAEATGEISYTATLTGGKQMAPVVQEAAAKAGRRAAFNFGKLETGTYQIKFTGENTEMQDAMEVSFTVVESGLLTPVVKTVELSGLPAVESAGWPVQATIYNDTVKPVFETLAWLHGQSGERAEIIAASTRAQEIYRELLPPDQRQSYKRDQRLERLVDGDGGIKPLPSAASDPVLTAKMFLAAPELLTRGNTLTYLQNVLKSPTATPDDRIMAYVGLASAKEPVLLDLRRLYEENLEILKTNQKLYVGAAFAKLGDFDQARAIYDSVRMVRSGELIYADDKDRTQTTAAALLLASELSHDDANGLAAYLMRGGSDSGKEGILWHLELLAYVEKAREQTTEGGAFTWVTGGKTVEVPLEQGAAALTLGSQALKEGKFRANSGKLYAAVQVLQPSTQQASGEFAEITKTYTPLNDTLRPGGQVKVTVGINFKEDAPYGTYTLSDYIPSGMRWLSPGDMNSGARMNIWPMITQDGQTISGTIYHAKPNDSGTPEPQPLAKVGGAYVRVLSEMTEKIPPNTDDISSQAQSTAPDEVSSAVSSEEASDVPEQDLTEDIEPYDPAADIEPYDPAADTEPFVPQSDIVETPEETGEIAPGAAPQAKRPPNTMPVAPQPQTPEYDATITYYVSAALPGSFVTESVWLTMDSQTVKSERGVIVIQD